MVAFYQRSIIAWMDGTEGLEDGEYRVYDVVCNLIYLNGGPIVAHEVGIAGRCNQHPLRFRRNLAKLIEIGKIVKTGDGKITNQRVESELRRIIGRGRPPADPAVTPTLPGGGGAGVERGLGEGNAPKPLKTRKASGGRVAKDNIRIEDIDSPPKPPALRDDDWPEDFLEQFWTAYPPYRRSARKTVAAKLATLRSRKEVTWAALMAGLARYVATNPGEFAKAPVVWINGGCWMDEHGGRNAGSNNQARSGGGGSYASIAARLRYGQLSPATPSELPLDEPPAHGRVPH